MAEGKRNNWLAWSLVNLAVSAWILYDMASEVEAPSQGVTLLRCSLLALSLIGLTGTAFAAMTRKD